MIVCGAQVGMALVLLQIQQLVAVLASVFVWASCCESAQTV